MSTPSPEFPPLSEISMSQQLEASNAHIDAAMAALEGRTSHTKQPSFDYAEMFSITADTTHDLGIGSYSADTFDEVDNEHTRELTSLISQLDDLLKGTRKMTKRISRVTGESKRSTKEHRNTRDISRSSSNTLTGRKQSREVSGQKANLATLEKLRELDPQYRHPSEQLAGPRNSEFQSLTPQTTVGRT